MGCCTSRPAEAGAAPPGHADGAAPVRTSPQAITSETAINRTGADADPRFLAPRSGHSIPQSQTSRSRSRSALSTPRHSVNDSAASRPNQPASLADHYNHPLQAPKPWQSTGRAWTRARLQRERYEFFETRVTGRPEIWHALKQVLECVREGDLADAQGMLDAIGVTLPTGRLEEGAYDEAGNLYNIPEPVVSDPTNVVVDDAADADTQTMTGTPDLDALAAKLEAAEGGRGDLGRDDSNEEKAKEAKGKGVVEKDSLKVRCRLSDRGGPDVVVLLGRNQRVGALGQRIRDETEIALAAHIRIAYLGRILDDKLTLMEQGWREGHVINALVVGQYG